ncbi:MAG: hypothetical protein RI924_840 [Bacteroidota bacterium]|jgi:outer membrane protein assembly factor BamA
MGNIKINYTIILLFGLILVSGCRATRFLEDDQVLVKKVELENFDSRFKEQAGDYIQRDLRPASALNLMLYNLVNTKNGKYRKEKIKRLGQAPAILDSSLVEISRVELQKFLATKGFLNARVQSQIQVEDKKAKLRFIAVAGPEFKVGNIQFNIPDSAVAWLYEVNRPTFTRLHTGMRYDVDSLATERELIYQLMKKNGYYEYLRQYVRFEVDTMLNKAHTADLKLYLMNPVGKNSHPVFSLDTTNILIRNSSGSIANTRPDSSFYAQQYQLKDYSGRFRLKPIAKYMFLKKGDRYNLEMENLTYDRLYELNVFRNVKVSYVKKTDSSNVLSPVLDLTPLKKMSNRIEGEYTFNAARNGFNLANTYTNRNVFGGAEQLDLKVRYGALFDTKSVSQSADRAFNRDFEIGANLIFPRILIPFRNSVSGRSGIPHTTISSSFQLFRQKDAFKNRAYINSITYDWMETRFKKHSFTPISLEYRNGQLDPAFKKYLEDNGYNLYVRTNDRQFVNFGSQYSFTYNNIRLNSLDNFFYFRAFADLSGNSLGLLSKALNLKIIDGNRTVFGLTYLQYAKTELDLRWYKHFGGDKQLVVRLNPGIGVPYGNSESLPIEKNFFAGGTNGIRAWQARTLGPGNYNRADIPVEIRQNLRNLDQLGEIKLEANLEYRFKILNNLFGAKLKGAAFTDLGNVWRIKPFNDNPGGEFRSDKFFQQIAIGAGAGLRFDMDYFIFRLDAAVKVKDPQFIGSEQWVIKNLFNKSFKQTFAQTNFPDVYRFVQYNFGIGMPF